MDMDIKVMLKRMKIGRETMRGSIPKIQYKMLNHVILMLDDYVRGRCVITRHGWKFLREFASIYEKADPELSAILASF